MRGRRAIEAMPLVVVIIAIVFFLIVLAILMNMLRL